MKLTYNIFYTIVAGLLFLSCSHIEEVEPEQLKPVEKVQMTLTAHMDMEESMTKTYLAGEPVASARNTYWLPTDEIGVLGVSLSKFTNSSADTSAVAVFEGKSELASQYYAIYPYEVKAFQNAGNEKLVFNIPAVQKYQKNTFATDVVPMVTKFKAGEELYFKNACGGLVIKVKGTEKIRSMRLVAYNQAGAEAKIAGPCLVDMNAGEYVITPQSDASTSISIDCGSGVQLKESEPVAFHFALAPATYHGFRVVMMSEDGKFMVKETDKELNIKRANITYAAPFAFEESESVDLSLRGTSNCYIISEANRYRFNASVIGNGTCGIIPDASFHTSDPSIKPVSAEVLWECSGANIKAAEGEILSDVILKDGYVHFTSTGKEGNALIAVKDTDGNILWSWHIWVTDNPLDQTYVNSAGTFVMQDRNLGAVRADQGSGDEYQESQGLLYQWGRKDPFSLGNLIYRTWSSSTSSYSVQDIIKMPFALSVSANSYSSSSNWTNQNIIDFWSENAKTIYDPCPVGYKVSSSSVWSDLTDLSKIQSSYDRGLMVKYNATEYSWYPFTYYNDRRSSIINQDGRIQIWSCDQSITNQSSQRTAETSMSYDKNNHSNGLTLSTGFNDVYALSVRCMKDDGFVDLAMPTVEMLGAKDVTAESATLSFDIINEGASEVTDAGIIYGTTSGLSLANGTKIPRMGEENSVEVTGLTEGTKYYAVAYATNSYGTAYSKEIVFFTEFANRINLSRYGTSNCYIVSEYGAYAFDASVRGSSTETVGTPASAEVLWETKNITKASAGEIIRSGSVELSGNFVNFVANGVEGNALIAVKDELGTILWSWHIWITDQPQDQHYSNSKGDFYLLDRNLGATRADRGTGDQWRESIGALYQWGRKDPLIQGIYTANRSISSIESSILHPTEHATLSAWNYSSYWESNNNKSLWTPKNKTIYDPCPQGYTVANIDAYYELTVDAEPNNGYYAHIKSSTDAWFPLTPIIWCGGNYIEASTDVIVWSSCSSSVSFCRLQIPRDDKQYWLGMDNSAMASPVRCMKDENYIDPLYASMVIKEIGEVTGSSATITTTITHIGKGDITSRGVVYGTTPTVTVENGTKVESTDNALEFVTQITGMDMATKYYVRAYAINEAGIAYSNPVSFHTLYEGEGINLSEDGTANSYIVPPTYAAYTFDCTVKGNSTESVGEAASAEVIWETKNTLDAVSLGEIIPSVELLDGKVKFMLPFEPVHGNALIAVKDAAGTIIWSWHIWVTDYDSETDADLYASGAKMMDRNLGALDDNARGFYYQWGRKDPLTHKDIAITAPENIIQYIDKSDAINTLDYAVSHPNHFIKSSSWNNDASLWAVIKTKYDPCPLGYRVSEMDMWADWQSSGHKYPGNGCVSGIELVVWNKNSFYSWLTDMKCIKSGNRLAGGSDVCDGLPVRCMKDAEIIPVTLTSSNITEEGATLNGKLTINDNTVIEEMGFVVSKTSSDISVSNENCTKFIVDSTTGEFSIEATGLVPNTTYYYRAFAKGGYNIKYGEVMEFRTHSLGISDDFTGDDYVWE